MFRWLAIKQNATTVRDFHIARNDREKEREFID